MQILRAGFKCDSFWPSEQQSAYHGVISAFLRRPLFSSLCVWRRSKATGGSCGIL